MSLYILVPAAGSQTYHKGGTRTPQARADLAVSLIFEEGTTVHVYACWIYNDMHIFYICLRAVPVTDQAVHAVIRFFVRVELTCALDPSSRYQANLPGSSVFVRIIIAVETIFLVLLFASHCV